MSGLIRPLFFCVEFVFTWATVPIEFSGKILKTKKVTFFTIYLYLSCTKKAIHMAMHGWKPSWGKYFRSFSWVLSILELIFKPPLVIIVSILFEEIVQAKMNKVVVTIISFSLLFSAAPGFSFLPSSHDRSQKDNIHESRESIHTHVDDEGHTHIHDDGGEIEVVFDSVEDKHSHSHQHDRNTTPHQHSHSHEGHSHGNATGGTIIGWVLNTSAKIKIPARSSKIQSAQLNNTAEDPYLSNIFRPPILI